MSMKFLKTQKFLYHSRNGKIDYDFICSFIDEIETNYLNGKLDINTMELIISAIYKTVAQNIVNHISITTK